MGRSVSVVVLFLIVVRGGEGAGAFAVGFVAFPVGFPQAAGSRAHAGLLAFAHLFDLGVDAVDDLVRALSLLGQTFLFPFALPFLLEPVEAGLGGGVEVVQAVGGEAVGGAVAQEEHQQAVVIDAAGADQLSVGVDRHFDAVDGAFHGDVLQSLHAERERGFPGLAEALALRVAAQEVGAFGRHVDGVGGGADRAGVGERLYEAGLALRRPSVVPFAQAGDGGEGWQGLVAAGVFRGGKGRAGLVDHRARLRAGGAGRAIVPEV